MRAKWSSSPAFQGWTQQQHHHARAWRLGHLCRGGCRSDQADECLIYTDVDGVYTTDPRVVETARRMDKITFEEMLEMASLGSKVLQNRSVEFAGKYQVKTRVLSSLTDPDIDVNMEANSGTLITFEEDESMEKQSFLASHSAATKPKSPWIKFPTCPA